MAALRDDDPDLEAQRLLAVKMLRKRLKEFEAFDWPPGTWDRFGFEMALREAEQGHHKVACQLPETHENPLRELIEAGFIALKIAVSKPKHYRRRIEAISARRNS